MSFPDVPVGEIADNAPMLDIREQSEWDLGHAPGAVHIPMGELPERLAELEPLRTDDAPILVTCRSGGRVSRVLPWLAQQGYDVANVGGGMLAWHDAGKPMIAADGQEPSVT